MRYTFLAIGDIHFGAMDIKSMYYNLTFVLDFIIAMKTKLDLVVICGDYFDYRLSLNSKAALHAIMWFDLLVDRCKKSDVKAIRLIRGTKSHDNDQLEAFRSVCKDDGYIKIFNECTLEETLPGLKCIYCPDEDITTDEFIDKNIEKLLSSPDMGFFHGNFDAVLPSIEIDRINTNQIPTIIYPHKMLSRMVKGPLISSHWHIPTTIEPLYYTGSYDRWKFGEEEDKGFIVGNYDNVDNTYIIERVINPHSAKYITLTYTSSEYTALDIPQIKTDINRLLSEAKNTHIRIDYIIDSDSTDVLSMIESLRLPYASNNRVKFLIKNLIEKKAKKKKKEITYYNTDTYKYIFDNPSNIYENLSRYILDKKGISVSAEDIIDFIDKYLKKK